MWGGLGIGVGGGMEWDGCGVCGLRVGVWDGCAFEGVVTIMPDMCILDSSKLTGPCVLLMRSQCNLRHTVQFAMIRRSTLP